MDKNMHPLRFCALVLTASTIVAACDVTSPGHEPETYFSHLSGDLPVTALTDIDIGAIHGLVVAGYSELHDTLFGSDSGDVSTTGILSGGFSVHDRFAASIRELRGNGHTLSPDSWPSLHRFYSARGSLDRISGGEDIVWEAELNDDITFNGTVALPTVPAVTNINSYDTVYIDRPLIITTADRTEGERVLVTLGLAPLRNTYFGDTTGIHPDTDFELKVDTIQQDDGTLTLTSRQMERMKRGGIYFLSVIRGRYESGERSDGKEVGMLAWAEAVVPVVLR